MLMQPIAYLELDQAQAFLCSRNVLYHWSSLPYNVTLTLEGGSYMGLARLLRRMVCWTESL